MSSLNVAAVLQRARTAARLTQAELAKRAGVSRMTVQQVEAGLKDPRMSTVFVLFRALGLELVVVPSALRPTVESFVQSGGRVIVQPAGTTAPLSIADEVRSELVNGGVRRP